MNVWNPMTVRAFAPALVGWCLALAASLRLEELRDDLHAQALLPVLQGSAIALLVFTLSCIGGASLVLWRAGRKGAG
ncbi:hypothetical protein I5U42_16375 [Stenotrophomonas maltophilia]|uniref:hypothetical protein n=1 Tax=Stenotrophomonas sp. RAC2 TaxID=3064902 RepID=UPI00131196E0|nr:hypothetical protein [Stenotrophomonas sp. RAC2]MBH1432878.1 hypothetical protein [Stenotrophomonas maltophilia]MDV9042434.1 hypothetical protein [Stenotrophomonas sp. RAC2]